jgi:hypothetical protein
LVRISTADEQAFIENGGYGAILRSLAPDA